MLMLETKNLLLKQFVLRPVSCQATLLEFDGRDLVRDRHMIFGHVHLLLC